MNISSPSPSRSIVTGLLVIALSLTIGCGQRETLVQKANREGIMLVGNGTEPADLDPQTASGVPEHNIIDTLFEGLTRLDRTNLEALPGVAENWDVSDDGLVYTFHLRENALWSDGVPVTAHDFHASFRRMVSPQLASVNADNLYPVVNAEDYHKGKLTDFSQVGVEAIDDHTFRVRLLYPLPFLPKSVASWYPVPMRVIEKFGDPLMPGNPWVRPGNIVSNGPFMLTKWKPNSVLEVAKSPTYWNRDTVRLNGIRFIPLENSTTEEASFRSGQLHLTSTVPLSKIATYQQNDPDKLQIHPYSGVYYYTFNVNREPFTDARVRQALAMAVDRESIVKNITLAGEMPAYHFTPEGIDSYVSEARTRFDLDEARRLLAEAGYPGGKGIPPITLLYNTSENHRVIAEAIQQTWKRELGIEMKLENQEWKVYLDNMNNRFYQISRAGVIMEPFDPSQFLRLFIKDSGFNRTGWFSPEYDALYEKVMRTNDEAERMKMMQRMEQILTDAMPILPIYYYTKQYLIDPSVHGWSNNLIARGPFESVWLE